MNATATGELARAITIPVIASGGVSTLADIEALSHLVGDGPATAGVSGAIVGRALYEGAIDLAAAQVRADELQADRAESALPGDS